MANLFQVMPHIGCNLKELRHAGLRSEEHTSELQSHSDPVCRLLLENKHNFLFTTFSEVDPMRHGRRGRGEEHSHTMRTVMGPSLIVKEKARLEELVKIVETRDWEGR